MVHDLIALARIFLSLLDRFCLQPHLHASLQSVYPTNSHWDTRSKEIQCSMMECEAKSSAECLLIELCLFGLHSGDLIHLALYVLRCGEQDALQIS